MRGLWRVAVSTAVVSAHAALAEPSPAADERARRLLDDAVLASASERPSDPSQDPSARFHVALEAAPRWAPALFDYAVALDRMGKLEEAEAAYCAAAVADDFPDLRFEAAARAASIAFDRGNAVGARSAVELARAALPEGAAPFRRESRRPPARHDVRTA